MEKIKIKLQKVIYGSLFCIALPLLLFFWIQALDKFITLPVPSMPILSMAMIAIGTWLLSAAMWNLWKKGKGLPMNAFPPKHYVQSGMYHLFHHPIYVGANLLLLGIACWFQSSAGFWFVSPLFIILTITYVIGYEREIIQNAFPNKTHTTFLDFPESKMEKSTFANRLKVFIWIYLPWICIYELFVIAGIPSDSIDSFTKLDDYFPLVPETVIIYLLAYGCGVMIPFFLQNNQRIRQFANEMIVIMILSFLCYLCIPMIAVYQYPAINNSFLNLILWDKSYDAVSACFPSFHAIWALMFARYMSFRFPKYTWLMKIIAWSICISCLLTKNHALVDILLAIVIFQIGIHYLMIYQYILKVCNQIGNSWKEWHWGNVRLINHGIYAGLSGLAGFLVMSIYLPQHLWIVYAIGCAGFIGAGLWAQFIEGSPSLLRPFGYYGSVVGIGITILCITLFSSVNMWILLAASCLAAPIIQAIGRLRCLVQGCCHGKIMNKGWGLAFNHEKSRVNKISGLKGQQLYPTQLYSICCNLIIFFVLFRMVSLNMPGSFITGLYLILNGAGRFVEERLRGETQTPYFMNMRVYQWLALISIIIGCVFTVIPSAALPASTWNPIFILYAIIYGCIITMVYGMDFPKSNIRFSRLTQ